MLCCIQKLIVTACSMTQLSLSSSFYTVVDRDINNYFNLTVFQIDLYTLYITIEAIPRLFYFNEVIQKEWLLYEIFVLSLLPV